MTDFLEHLPIDQEWLTYLAVLSAITFTLSLIIIPWLITRLPADYFVRERSSVAKNPNKRSVVGLIVLFLKNLLGIILIVAGIIMLVLPGQGILTILIGLGISDFPGRYRLEHWLVKKPAVFKTMNWLRGKRGVTPLIDP